MAGVVDAAMEGAPVTQHLFGMKKSVIRSEVLYDIINKNAKLARMNIPDTLKEAYHPWSFKTSEASGNFPISKMSDKNVVSFWTPTTFSEYFPSTERLQQAKAEARDIAEKLTADELTAAERDIIAEQEKTAQSLTSGKIYVTAGNLAMSGFSLLMAIQDLSHDPSSIEKLWKTMGSFVGLAQAYCEGKSLYMANQATQAIEHEIKTGFAKKASLYKAASNIFSKTIAVIGIIDGLVAILKAYNKYHHGGTSHDMKIEMWMGGLSITGAILTLTIGAAVFLPVMLTLGIIFFGLCNSLIHLVPANIENWLRRSLYGTDQNFVMGKTFKDFEDEQSSLKMVLRGITIDVSIDNNKSYYATTAPSSYVPDDNYILGIGISFYDPIPKSIVIEIRDQPNDNRIILIKNIDEEFEFREVSSYITGEHAEYNSNLVSTVENKNKITHINIFYKTGITELESYKIIIDIDNETAKDIYYVTKN